MFWFIKSYRKGLVKKLRFILDELSNNFNNKNQLSLNLILKEINQTLNDPEFNHDDLPFLLNEKLYENSLIQKIIILLPYFNKDNLTLLTTIFLTSIRCNFPKNIPIFFLNNIKYLEIFLNYLTNSHLTLYINLILRSCFLNEQFIHFLFENNIPSMFYQYFNINSFDILSSNFQTFEDLLFNFSEYSMDYISTNYQIYSIFFKLMLMKSNYLIKLLFLPLLLKILINENSKIILLNFLSDSENLFFILNLFNTNSIRILNATYHIFKLFILNPKKNYLIKSIIISNNEQILKLLKKIKFNIDDIDLINQKDLLINKIVNLIHK